MFSTVIENIISFLTESGINAVMAFPETVIDKSKATVCASMRSHDGLRLRKLYRHQP